MRADRKIILYNRKGEKFVTGTLRHEGHVIEDNEVGTIHLNFYDFILAHGGVDALSSIDLDEPQPKTLIHVLSEAGMLDTADPLVLK